MKNSLSIFLVTAAENRHIRTWCLCSLKICRVKRDICVYCLTNVDLFGDNC